MSSPVLQVTDLSKRFGDFPAVDGISFEFDSGHVFGFVGPNGAGKSTLIQTLLGFHKPSAGRARILGFDCHAQAREVKARIGYMPENDSFIADMTAVAFVKMMAELSGLPGGAALERAHEVLFYVGLGEARYRPLGTYSLGMKQLAKLLAT